MVFVLRRVGELQFMALTIFSQNETVGVPHSWRNFISAASALGGLYARTM